MTNTGTALTNRFLASADTAAVLLFLTMEYGRAVKIGSAEGLITGITIGMVLVLPYFLLDRGTVVGFTEWILARSIVAAVGWLMGVGISQTGPVLPDHARLLPMTFLIIAAMVSCYVRFYGLIKLRLAK